MYIWLTMVKSHSICFLVSFLRATKSVVHQDGLELTETPKWRETLLLLEVIQLKTNLVFDETLILAVFDLLAL